MEFSELVNVYKEFPSASLTVYDYELGSGQFGTVFKGQFGSNKSTVAVKKLNYKADGKINEELQKRGTIELEIFNKLKGHEHIVQILAHHNDGTNLWLVQEYCEKGDLKKFSRSGEISLAQKVKIMQESAKGIEFMHSRNPPIAHRDIKPENILIKSVNGEDVVKIGDFGLGKLFEMTKDQNFMMTTLAGSYFYLAPEFFSADGGYLEYSKTIDVFSLGLVFLFLLQNNGDEEFKPCSVNPKLIPIGLEMSISAKAHTDMPSLFPPPEGLDDSNCMKELRKIITEMTKYEGSDRMCLKTTVAELTEIRGKLQQQLDPDRYPVYSRSQDKVDWMEKPDWIIQFDAQGQMLVNESLCERLQNIKYKVEVVSVVGNCRLGKSFLLNQLAATNKGFTFNKGVKAVTQGVWIWVKQHPLHEQKALILMDTEGLDDASQRGQPTDCKIFTLAVLLSTTLIYNLHNRVGSSDLSELQYVVKMLKQIGIKQNIETGRYISCFTPKLIMLLRNYDDEEIKSDTEVNDYVNDQVLMVSGKEPEEDKEIKVNIAKCFPIKRRHVHTLPSPVDSIKMLGKLHLIEDIHSELDEDFVSQFQKLEDDVFQNGEIFAILSGEVMIPGWITLLQKYVDALNNDGKVDIQKVLQSAEKVENTCKQEPRPEEKHYEEQHEKYLSLQRQGVLRKRLQEEKESFQLEYLRYKDKNQELAEMFLNMANDRRNMGNVILRWITLGGNIGHSLLGRVGEMVGFVIGGYIGIYMWLINETL